MNSHFFHKYALGLSGAAPLFALLSAFSLLVIAIFSINYLDKEKGRFRYWLLYTLFSGGILLCCFSANLETFYVGWEMVGLASFFLIAFYQENSRSLENSLIALANYKICDIFFVMAIFFREATNLKMAALCLILATLAKSAQFPFSSWLYKALEGPTPSSTVFYGGLSLHLGPFLLLQYSNLWEPIPELRYFMGAIGIASTFYGLLVGATRSDLKTSFAFASTSQVGLIFIELALGFYQLALWHIVGHNILRTWNYLRTGSFFDDFFLETHLRNSLNPKFLFSMLPRKIYFHALNGFYLDKIFVWIRDGGLILFISLCLYYSIHGLEDGLIHWEFLLVMLSLILSIFYFINPKQHLKNQFLSLIASQILVLSAIHLFYEEQIEESYLMSSLLSLAGLVYCLWPALSIWFHESSKSNQNFLGLAKYHSLRHSFFILFCISITASPGSIQFFLQESVLDGLWNRSHSFMISALVCMTLNSYHFFRIGQRAFLGRQTQHPKRELAPAYFPTAPSL